MLHAVVVNEKRKRKQIMLIGKQNIIVNIVVKSNNKKRNELKQAINKEL